MGRVVFYADNLSGPRKKGPGRRFAHELGCFIADSGNHVAIDDEGPSAKRLLGTKQPRESAARRRGGSRVRFHDVEDFALGQTSNPIDPFAPAPLRLFGIAHPEAAKKDAQRRGRQSGAARVEPIETRKSQRPVFGAAGSMISPSDARAFSQSFKKVSSPRSVSGCLKSCSKTL